MKNLLGTIIIILLPALQCLAQNGVIKSYYPDRTIKSEITYVNDILDGNSIWYYPNGKIKLEKNYSKGILNGWVREYYENGRLKEEFYVNNGIIDGDRKKYSDDGTLENILSYSDGQLTNSQQFEKTIAANIHTDKEVIVSQATKPKQNQIEVPPVPKRADVYSEPQPIGGMKAVQDRIIYPKDALSYGLEGTVIVSVDVDETGNPGDVKIEKGIGLGCDEAAIAAVKLSRFIPGKKNDVPIESSVKLNLEFKLPEQKKEIAEAVKTEDVKKPIRKFEEHLSVICEADRCPRPEDNLATIYSRFEIPNVAKALKLTGMILIEGIVDKEGNLKRTNIIEGVGYGCDQLVESSLLKSKFIPATKKGEAVEAKALINFPFNYEWAQ